MGGKDNDDGQAALSIGKGDREAAGAIIPWTDKNNSYKKRATAMNDMFRSTLEFIFHCHDMRAAGDKEIENHPAYRAAMNYIFANMGTEAPELAAMLRAGFNQFFPDLAAKAMFDGAGNRYFRSTDLADALGVPEEELLSLAREMGECGVQLDPADLHALN
jgi:hypothetical protein